MDRKSETAHRVPAWIIKSCRVVSTLHGFVVSNLFNIALSLFSTWLLATSDTDYSKTPFVALLNHWLIFVLTFVAVEALLVVTWAIGKLQIAESPRALKRQYLTNLVYQTQDLTIEGIPLLPPKLQLDEIFITMQLRPHQSTVDQLLTEEQRKLLREGIRYGTVAPEVESVLIAVERDYERLLNRNERIEIEQVWQHLTRDHPVAVIQGTPGMGKSTLMQRFVLFMARRGLGQPDPLGNWLVLPKRDNSFTRLAPPGPGDPLMKAPVLPRTFHSNKNLVQSQLSLFIRLGRYIRKKLVSYPNRTYIDISSFLVVHQQPKANPSPPLIPLFIRLGRYATFRLQSKDSTFPSLWQYLRSKPRELDILATLGMLTWLFDLLEHGQCIVIFDGLDEVSDARARYEVQEAIKTFVNDVNAKASGANSYNRFLITSRVAGYDQNAFPGYSHYTLAELTTDQISQFLPRWCRACILSDIQYGVSKDVEAYVSREATGMAQTLTRAIEGHQSIKTLAENPFLLTLLAIMQRNGIELPERRADLYATITQVLLETRNALRKLPMIPEAQAIQRLGPIAYEMQVTKNSFASRRDVLESFAHTIEQVDHLPPEQAQKEAEVFLERMRERGGIFVLRAGDYLGFFHRSFQEYWGLPMVGTESWNRKIAQKNYGSLEGNLEKLFGRGGELSKWTMVSLGNSFWEGEMVFAKDVDMLQTQRS